MFWQQPAETFVDNFNLNNTNFIATAVTTQTAHTPEPGKCRFAKVVTEGNSTPKIRHHYGTVLRK